VIIPKGTDLILYRQLAEEIIVKIENKQLITGDKLLSVRKYARQQGVSINTVVSCYQLLEQLNFISAKEKVGYVVLSKILDENMPLPTFLSKSIRLSNNNLFNKKSYFHPFERAQASPDLLSVTALTKCLTNAVRKHAKQVQLYGDVQGEQNLRRNISQHFKQQGFMFNNEELVINNGCLDAIKIAIELVSNSGDSIAVSSPCFSGLLSLLAVMKREVVEVPSHQQGLDVAQIESLMACNKVAACLFTANYQNPLGQSLSLEQKKQLAKLSNQYDVPIIEDDVYQELSFEQTLPLPIKAFDNKGTVLWCSSISKTLASGYRIGWALPGIYLNKFVHYRAVQSLGVNLPLQLGVTEFIEKKLYSRHLKRLRQQLAKQMLQYQHLLTCELAELDEFYISQPDGGLVLWVYVKGLDALTLSHQVEKQGIGICSGNDFSTRGLYNSYFRINIGYPLTDELKAQLRKICLLVKQQLVS
jgi:DNA-binding transcriptional MocR family regulator